MPGRPNCASAGSTPSFIPSLPNCPKQFKFADKMKMKMAVTIGPDEAEKGLVAVKNLSSGDQQIIPQSEAVKVIRDLLDEPGSLMI